MATQAVADDCTARAARMFLLPQSLMTAILEVEGGKTGEVSYNRNGTYDMGPAQVNSVHSEKLRKFGITEKDIIENRCINILAAAYIVKKHYDSLPEDMDEAAKFAEAAGRYHSKTPKFKAIYQQKLLKAALRLTQQGETYP